MRDDNLDQGREPEMSRRRFILLATATAVVADVRSACAKGSGEHLIDAGPLRKTNPATERSSEETRHRPRQIAEVASALPPANRKSSCAMNERLLKRKTI